MKDSSVISLKFIIIICFLYQGQYLFSQENYGKLFGGHKDDKAFSMCKTGDGGTIIVGNTRSVGAGSNDIFVFKIDINGEKVWEKSYGWEHHDFGKWIEPCRDGNFIISGYNWDFGMAHLDMYALKIDPDGNKIWMKFYGTHQKDLGFCVKEDSDGFILLGYSIWYDTRGDIMLIKTDIHGNEIWRQNLGTEFNDYGFEIINTIEDDGYLIVGSAGGFYESVHGDYLNHDSDVLLIKTDNDGNQLWQKQWGGEEHDFGQCIEKANDNSGYFILASSQSYGSGSFDMTLIKVDLDGNELFNKSFGGESWDMAYSLSINDDNEIFICGTTASFGFENSIDYYIVKTDENGELIWELSIGGPNSDYGQCLTTNNEGGCMLGGYSKSFGLGGADIYLIKLNRNGIIESFLSNQDSIFDELIAKAYPNPFNKQFTVSVSPFYENYSYELKIYDIVGEIVYQSNINKEKSIIGIPDITTGTYIYTVDIKSTNQIIRGKLIKN